MERIIAVILLIVLFPIFVLVSLSIFIFSGTPIFFTHNRCGFQLKGFKMYKFRTMQSNDGPEITRYNDDRITVIGKLLRKSKFDEFPQLFNIIKGEMNFIGPRPETIAIVKKYPDYFSYLKLIKPGISDIGSVIFKDESSIFKNVDINKYEDEILPIKSHLAKITSENLKILNKSMLIILVIVAIIHHKLSLRIISKFFLPYDETKLRMKLNNLLSLQIF